MSAAIGALPVLLRGIVGHRKEYLQELAVSDLSRIVSDLDRFGVAGEAGADDLVMGGYRVAAGESGQHPIDAV